MNSRRTDLLLVVTTLGAAAALLWPLWLSDESHLGAVQHPEAPLLVAALIPLLVLAMLFELSSSHLDAKSIAILGVLCAGGAALRIPTGGLVPVEMVFFLLIPGGRVMGRGFGFIQGALTIGISAILTAGVGPWLPFQMIAAAWIGLGAGCLPPLRGRAEVLMLGCYAAVSSYLFGLVLDLWFWPFAVGEESSLSFVAGDSVVSNLRRFLVFHFTTSLGWDTARAVTLVSLTLMGGPSVLAALRRTRRMAVVRPVPSVPALADS